MMYNYIVLQGGDNMISNRIKSARKYRKLTQEELAKKINSTKSTISNYENSYSSPSAEVISMLSDALETSTDYLLEKTDEIEIKQKYYDLTKKDENDIEKELEKILSNLDSSDGLAFSGEPLDDETRELLSISLERSLRFARQESKRKFTPQKFRDKDSD